MVVGGPQSDYSVCPHPLCRVFSFSGFWVYSCILRYTQVHSGTLRYTQIYWMKALRGLKKFSGGWWLVVVHKVIIVSVRVLYVGFSISLVFGFRVFRLVFGFRVFGFSGFQVLGFQVFQTGRDARFFGRDRMGRGARQQLYFYHFSQLISQSLWIWMM